MKNSSCFQWIKHNILIIIVSSFGIINSLFIYFISPHNRVYSHHGFIHAGIFYQILNGNIPPPQPFLGGLPLLYHWGFHFLAVIVSKVFNVSPFWSFAVINLFSLFLSIIIIYKLSTLLVKDKLANILSVIVPIFALTPYGSPFRYSAVATPIAEKFTNSNGVPIGLVFLLLSIYFIINIFKESKFCYKQIVIFFFLVIGLGFFYPPFLVGVIASFPFLFISFILDKNKKRDHYKDLKIISIIILIIFTGIGVLWPYLSQISLGIVETMKFSNLFQILYKLRDFSLIACPIIFIIFLSRKALFNSVDRKALTILSLIIISNFLIYILFTQHLGTERKYRLITCLSLGVIGGISFRLLIDKFGKNVVILILIIFSLPYFYDYWRKIYNWLGVKPIYVEKGIVVSYIESEEEELYKWIRENTNKQSIFIDVKPHMPIFGQRQLFVAPLHLERDGYIYNPSNVYFGGYDSLLVRNRRRFVVNIATEQVSNEIYDFKNDLYYVQRNDYFMKKPNQQHWNKVFETPTKEFTLYKLKNQL